MTKLRLAEICGKHCTDANAVGAVARVLAASKDTEVAVSFADVASLSPSFVGATLLAIDEFKKKRPGARATLVDLSTAQVAVVKAGLRAAHASSDRLARAKRK